MRPFSECILRPAMFGLIVGLVTIASSLSGVAVADERDGTPAPEPPSLEIQRELTTLAEDLIRPGPPIEFSDDLQAFPERMAQADPSATKKAADTTGGDDVTILTHDGISYYDMDIASNGDIYVAVTIDDPSYDLEIRVYRSQDGGDSWNQWGRIYNTSSAITYFHPSIHVAEGNEDWCFLACSVNTGVGDTREIRVYRADIANATASFTSAFALEVPWTRFARPHLTSDAVSYASYFLYLVAENDDGDGRDIWFTRSTDRGASWETGYMLASLSSGDRDYSRPKVCYGFGGYVHVTWMFSHRSDVLDEAVRYRRAEHYAVGGLADWNATEYLTPNTNGMYENYPVVGASPDGAHVAVVFSRRDASYSAHYSEMRVSTDSGVNWPAANYNQFFGYHPTVCRTDAAADWVVGASGGWSDGPATFRKAPPADPLSLGSMEVLSDGLYWNAQFYSKTVALDPSRGHQVAMLWNQVDIDGATTDKLFFDAEWRGGPGYPNFEDGFPLPLSYPADTPPAVVDLDGDSDMEIVFSDTDGRIQVFEHDGTVVAGWGIDLGSIPTNAPVAIGDLHGDGVPEVAVGTTNGRVYLFSNEGELMPGFPVNLGTNADTHVAIGALEPPYVRYIVVTSGTRLYVLNYAGQQQGAGYPVTFSGTHTFGAAIGDVDDDGINEIVTSRDNFIHVHTLQTHIPKMWRNLGAETTNDRPTLADVDLDGDLEIAIPTVDGDVFLMHHDGSDYVADPPNSWPFTVDSPSPVTSVAFADNLWTSEPELAFAARNWEVYLMYDDGRVQSAYPKYTGTGWYLWGAPIIDDVSVSASSVVVGSRDSKGWAWRNTGSLTPGWPKGIAGRCNVSPASGDIDNDGNNEFIFATLDELVVVDVNQPPSDHWRDRWQMYAHDPMRTGNLNYVENLATTTPPAHGLTRLRFASPRPNPSGGQVYLEYELPINAAVSLDVYDLRGRRVRQLRKTEQGAGPYLLSWDGRDARGRQLASGTYVVQLRAVGPGLKQELTRKVTLRR